MAGTGKKEARGLQITHYNLKDFVQEEEISNAAIYCDQKGQCLLHDPSHATADMIRDALNEGGEERVGAGPVWISSK